MFLFTCVLEKAPANCMLAIISAIVLPTQDRPKDNYDVFNIPDIKSLERSFGGRMFGIHLKSVSKIIIQESWEMCDIRHYND